jgi:hypothetical protein
MGGTERHSSRPLHRSCLIATTDPFTDSRYVLFDSLHRTHDKHLTILAQTVIQKEWLDFGHKFNERSSHGCGSDDQRSPIFVLWLDCVWQVLR